MTLRCVFRPSCCLTRSPEDRNQTSHRVPSDPRIFRAAGEDDSRYADIGERMRLTRSQYQDVHRPTPCRVVDGARLPCSSAVTLVPEVRATSCRHGRRRSAGHRNAPLNECVIHPGTDTTEPVGRGALFQARADLRGLALFCAKEALSGRSRVLQRGGQQKKCFI